jgi:hypothetical protein
VVDFFYSQNIRIFDKLCFIKRLQIEDVLCIYGYSYYSAGSSISAFISLGLKFLLSFLRHVETIKPDSEARIFLI